MGGGGAGLFLDLSPTVDCRTGPFDMAKVAVTKDKHIWKLKTNYRSGFGHHQGQKVIVYYNNNINY